MKQKRYKDAIRHFSEAARIDPNDEKRKRNLALAREQIEKATAAGSKQ
jgi:Flp pilus assembly protein TadD